MNQAQQAYSREILSSRKVHLTGYRGRREKSGNVNRTTEAHQNPKHRNEVQAQTFAKYLHACLTLTKLIIDRHQLL